MPELDSAPPADDPDVTRHPASEPTELDPHATRLPESNGDHSSDVPAASATRFRVLHTHARGGLGEVSVAHDEELGRKVAFKEIQDRYADHPESRARFLLEAKVTGSLEHPGIVPVYSLGHHADGRPYYAMRFIRGASLKEAIEDYHRDCSSILDPIERDLRLRTLLGQLVEVCNAIEYAHSRHVLHRDLKPDNVMLGPFGETLVVDWGLAKQLGQEEVGPGPVREQLALSGGGSATLAGSTIGTPAFMSPEQAAGDLDKLGPASDVYSLGATLYCVLTGRAPFGGRDIGEVLGRVRRGEFTPPRRIRRDVSRALEAICLKAMATRTEDRYPTAYSLADDIKHWLAGASVPAYRDWLPVRLWRWSRRRPTLTMVAIVCVFIDVLALVGLLGEYARTVLHDRLGSFLRIAGAGLVFAPFACQAGALLGAAIGTVIGAVCRRGATSIRRAAKTGLIAGAGLASVGVIIYLVAIPSPAPGPSTSRILVRPETLKVLALPGAVVNPPAWLRPGAPFDVAAFFSAPAPGENAARSYLDALMEFDPGMAVCFSPEEGQRRGELARERLKRYQAWIKDPTAADLLVLDELLDEYEVGFLKLTRAQRSRCVFQTGIGIGTPLPHAQAARQVANVIQLRSRRQLERGEIDRAIRDLDGLLHLSRDLRPRGDVIVQLVSVAIENVAFTELVPPILDHPEMRAAYCVRLLSLLDRHIKESLDPFIEGYRSEYLTNGKTIHYVATQIAGKERWGASQVRELLRPLLAGDSPYGGLDEESVKKYLVLESAVTSQLAKTTSDAFVAGLMRDHDAYYRELLDLAKLPFPERIRQFAELAPLRLAGQPLLLNFAPTSGAYLKALARYRACVDATRCLIALRLRELEGKGPPVDLSAAVQAAGMPEVPPDPLRGDGGPLQLATVQGSPVVYSVGQDGIDDLGQLDSDSGRKPLGDLLFPLRARRSGR